MKIVFASAAALSLLTSVGFAQIAVDGVIEAEYGTAAATDPTNATDSSEATPGGDFFPHLDVENLFMSTDGTNLFIAIQTANPIGVSGSDWGQLHIAINSPGITGNATTIAWTRNVTVNTNFFVGSWSDSGGGHEFHSWDDTAGSWEMVSASWDAAINLGEGFVLTNDTDKGVLEVSIPLSALGNPSSVDVAAYTTGGLDSDPPIDIIPSANGNTAEWSDSVTIADFHTFSLAASVEAWQAFD